MWAGLTAAERAAFDPEAAACHARLHAAETALIRHDGALFWRHNVNYPGLVRLVQNSFYRLTETDFREGLENRLDELSNACPETLERILETLRPWLFSKPRQ